MLAPSAAYAAFPGHNGKLAFARGEYARSGIYTIHPDAGPASRVTRDSDYDPAWSPDGTKLAYSRFTNDEEPTYGFIANADGSGERLLGQYFDGLTWSPDGTKLVLTSFGDIYTINADGTGLVAITGGSDTDRQPVWSPDGSKIAFVRSDLVNDDIWIVNPDGTAATNLTPGSTVVERDPNWTPDGAGIAFTRFGPTYPYTQNIWTMNADGGGQAPLTTNGTSAGPAWSPDGTRMAFYFCPPSSGACQVSVMNADGSDPKPVLDGFSPDWQPCASACPPPPPPPYDVPRAADRLTVSLVPNYRETVSQAQCEARAGRASTHGPPLAFQACDPPALLPETVAHFGASTLFGASRADLILIDGDSNPANGDGADILLEWKLNHIHTASGAAYNPNPSGPDVQLVLKLRMSDQQNGPGLTQPGTVIDFELPVQGNCSPLVDPYGSNCGSATSFDALVPDFIKEGKNTVIQAFQVRAKDVGPNGTLVDADDSVFATQGIYVP